MESFEFILVILFCIIVSTVAARFIPKVTLPIVQIAVGLIAALILPDILDIHIESDLFLVLFIAPLLFNEARNANKRELWYHKWPIISLAVGLVVATVLIVGFVLHWIEPSIPLAAAFALAGALGPTDAAAVSALGSEAKLTTRQEVRLSGESLINDASGIVSFQFAIAAAITGTFSAIDAIGEFSILFFGGILFGVLIGALAKYSIKLIRSRGFEDTRLHVVYQVFTPFVVFLAAEWIGVSGILAVVACGIVMSQSSKRLVSTVDARNQMVSNSVWSVIVFLINGTIFTLLGMQLPIVFKPSIRGDFSAVELLALVVLIYVLIALVRFIWIACMEFIPKHYRTSFNNMQQDAPIHANDPQTVKEKMKSSLIMTLAAPKGSITLSIIFTIPITLTNGELFPARDVLIFLTAGVILLTLVMANVFLPIVNKTDRVPKNTNEELHQATIIVLQRTIDELVKSIKTTNATELIPALRLTIAKFRTKLARARFSDKINGENFISLNEEIIDLQQKWLNEIQRTQLEKLPVRESIEYYQALRSIRESVGYYGDSVRIGTELHSLKERCYMLVQNMHQWLKLGPINSMDQGKIYYDCCMIAIFIEQKTLNYLEKQEQSSDPSIAEAASLLKDEHEAALDSIWGRICFIRRDDDEFKIRNMDREDITYLRGYPIIDEIKITQDDPTVYSAEIQSFSEQFRMAKHYADMVDAWALTVELEQIQRLYSRNEISEQIEKELRREVYVFQMALNSSEM